MKLTKKDFKDFKRVVDGAVYMKRAYKQGFKDGAKVTQKLYENIIEDGVDNKHKIIWIRHLEMVREELKQKKELNE